MSGYFDIKGLRDEIQHGLTTGECIFKDGFILSKDGTELLDAPKQSIVVIPEGVTTIRHSIYANDNSLKEIYFPDSVTELGAGLFYGCKTLEKVRLSDNITQIPKRLTNSCELTCYLYPCHTSLQRNL